MSRHFFALLKSPIVLSDPFEQFFDKPSLMIYMFENSKYPISTAIFLTRTLFSWEKQMMQKNWTVLAVILILAFLVTFSVSSCAKKKISSESATTTAEEDAQRRADERARQKELERQKGLEEEDLGDERISEEMAEQRTASAKSIFENEDVYFEFDSIRLAPDAQEILVKKAKWLRANPAAKIIIEGHCDNRGTNEYNLALGEGRAESARAFLVDLGIDGSRQDTISYGEERPMERVQSEEGWAKNRRAHFRIIE